MGIKKYIPDTITSANLLSGTAGVIFTLSGNVGAAFACMLAAAVFDFCDGLSARLLNAYSDLGKELDSLSDVVSFGLLPSLMLRQTMVQGGAPWYLSAIPLLIVVFSAVRLAKFNIDTEQTTDFTGLATPSSAMICGSLSALCAKGGCPWDGIASSLWIIPLLSVILSALLVSRVPMFGMKIKKGHKLLDSKRIAFLILSGLCIAATAVLRQGWPLAVLMVFLVYVAENLVLHFFGRTNLPS